MSSITDPDEVKRALERRGVYLNPGAKAEVVTKKAKEKHINIDPFILSIYSRFNGFQEGILDPGSGIRIWPIEDILETIQGGQSEVTFADFLINSNAYKFDIENSDAPVFLDSKEEIVANSFLDFLSKLLSGEFDF